MGEREWVRLTGPGGHCPWPAPVSARWIVAAARPVGAAREIVRDGPKDSPRSKAAQVRNMDLVTVATETSIEPNMISVPVAAARRAAMSSPERHRV